jgi:hypothetical protein
MPQLVATGNVNLAGVLHGEQELIFHNPIPAEGTLTTEGAITHYYDKGREKGALVVAEFKRPLYPGMPIKTVIWQTGKGKALWKVINVESEEVVIDNGVFEYAQAGRTEIRHQS